MEKPFYCIIRIIYYCMIIILIYYLIIPHTSIAFRSTMVFPFALRLNKESITLEKGESVWLHVIGFSRKAVFVSEDFKTAEVNSAGRVKAKRVGKTVIKVDTGRQVLKCQIKVVKPEK